MMKEITYHDLAKAIEVELPIEACKLVVIKVVGYDGRFKDVLVTYDKHVSVFSPV